MVDRLTQQKTGIKIVSTMEHLILSCRKFADLCGVSPAAISKAGIKGTLYRDPKTKKYDLSHDDNYFYYKEKVEEAGGTAEPHPLSQSQQKKKPIRKSTVKPTKPAAAKPKGKGSQSKSKGTRSQDNQRYSHPGEMGEYKEPDVRRDYEIQKIKFDSKLKELAYEKELGTVVLRDNVQHIWNKIYKSASYFGDFGQKYSGEWAAALGISDPEKILALQKLVDRDTELFIADFTETVASEI